MVLAIFCTPLCRSGSLDSRLHITAKFSNHYFFRGGTHEILVKIVEFHDCSKGGYEMYEILDFGVFSKWSLSRAIRLQRKDNEVCVNIEYN